jgi:hypothetical protein
LGVLVAALSSTAAASPATRDECAKAMGRIKAWEGDPSPANDSEMADCVKQATGEQARCIIAAATKEAGKACIGVAARPTATATAPPRAEDPLDKVAPACRLTASAPKPLTGPLAHTLRNGGDDVQPHQSIIVKLEEQTRLFDPADLRRLVPAPEDLREGVLLPSRLVGVRGHSELVTAPPSGTPLTSLRKGSIHLLDAIAVGRETFVAGTGESRAPFVDRLDGSGKLIAHHEIGDGAAMAVRLARGAGGALALAWLTIEGNETVLRFAWLDRDGGVKDKPVRVDRAPERQQFANLTMAPHGDGVVMAWNPIVAKGEGERVPIEIRILGADPGAAPSSLRRVATASQSWVVAGSAGGVLPNLVQALPFGRQTAIVWWAIDKESSELRGVLADGGAPVVLTRDLRGQPIARSDGKSATVLIEAREGGQQLLTVRCEK